MQTLTPNLAPAIVAPKIWTDEEFMALPDDGHHYEIINGELIDMGNSGAQGDRTQFLTMDES